MAEKSFNPRMILYQMVAIQSIFYAAFVSSTVFVSILFGFPYRLGKFFDFATYSFETTAGGCVCVMLWTNLVFMSFLLPRIIERTRKCLDFVVTLVVVHLCFSWASFGFPWSASWWTVWTLGAVACTVLGEYLCLREEQREIPIAASDDDSVELGSKTAE